MKTNIIKPFLILITMPSLILFPQLFNEKALYSKNIKKSEITEKKKKTDAEKAKKKLELEKKRTKWIEDTLKFGVHKDRIDAINKIHKIKNESFKRKLIKQLVDLIETDKDPEVLVKAITVAGDLKEKAIIKLMPEKLESNSEDVKIAAVYAIKNLKASSQKGILINKIKKQDFSEESNYTEALIHTLGDFKASEISEFAIKQINDVGTTKNNRQLLVLFLGKSGSTSSKDFLIKTYNDDDEEVVIRSYAINSLAYMNITGSIKHINDLLTKIESYPFKKRKKYYNLYLYSVAALVKLGDKNAIPKLMEILKSDNSNARLKAVRLLKELKDKRTIDILKYKLKYDPNKNVQKAAKEALKEMGVKTDDEKKEK